VLATIALNTREVINKWIKPCAVPFLAKENRTQDLAWYFAYREK
jgi:hypothetical protein